MRLLLITYYWQPWNNPGVFRWLWFSHYIPIQAVLTCWNPQGSFLDETLPAGYTGKISFFPRTLGILWGILIIPKALWLSRNVDKVVITSPPESLIFTAWILQLFGREVYLDLRDSINRDRQRLKFMVPVYRFLYRRLKNVCVVMAFMDYGKLVIRHGYDPVMRVNDVLEELKAGGYDLLGRQRYADFITRLGYGMRIDYQYCKGYGARTAITAIKYGLADNLNLLHPEYQTIEPQSWETQAEKMKNFLEGGN